jgi:transposase-like protein
MDPQAQFCPNPACRDRGKRGQGNIGIHSQKEQRYRCTTCHRTFAATTGTVHYRLRTPEEVVTQVVTLLCHGCPVQAIVAAFGLDERTVAAWQQRAGTHCQRVHEHLVQAGQVELGHVQAAELWVKMHKGRAWQAMAMSVASRLWLGGVLSVSRDRPLLRRLAQQIRACACRVAVLVCVDGLAGYVRAMGDAFRVPRPTGKPGRPPLERPKEVLLAQVIKKYAQRRVVSVTHRVVLGTAEAVEHVLTATQSGTVINTAYIERLNATFRACLAPLARRTRALAHQVPTLTAGMYLVGTAYNFCWPHTSLRLRATNPGHKWVERTPAMAAGLTDHCWTMHDLLTYQVPLPLWVAPKRRGRPPNSPAAGQTASKRRGRPPKQPALEVAA